MDWRRQHFSQCAVILGTEYAVNIRLAIPRGTSALFYHTM